MAPIAPPRPEAAFIGRDRELEHLAALVAAHRTVAIVGSGGCGKTRLAIELARRTPLPHGDAVAWIDLAPVSDADRVDAAVAVGLGLHTPTGLTRQGVLDHLTPRSLLLVVDNCEHVIDAAADLIAAVGDACPQVHVIATSREPLDLTDEIVWRVPSLTLPSESTLEAVTTSEAGRLLIDRMRRARPGVELEPRDARAVVDICRQLDGIPLALELAAARSATMAPAAIATRLSERFTLLTGGGRNVLPRQRTLEASISWSHQLLDDHEATVFRRLAVFTSSFALDAAIEVVGDDVGDPAAVTRIVLRLAERSLLTAPGGDTEPRFQMLETIRHFARERLIDAGDAAATRERHLRWFVSLATSFGPRLEGPEARELVEALEADLDNLRTALAWAADQDRPDDLLDIAASLPWFWIWRGRMREGLDWLEAADGLAVPALPRARLAQFWAREQIAIHFRADHAEIERWSLGALALAREVGDRAAEGRLLVSWGMHCGFRDPTAAAPVVDAGLTLCLGAGDPFWAGYGLASAALCLQFLGRHDLAAPHLDRLAEASRRLGNPQLAADHLARRSLADLTLGDHDAVLLAAERIDAITEGLTEINVRGIALTNAAHVRVARGQAAHALVDVDALFARYLREGEYQHLPGIMLAGAAALTALGRGDEALDRLRSMWPHPDLQATMPFRLWFRQAMGVATFANGDQVGARALLLEAVADAEASGSDHDVALAERFLAAIDRADGEHSAAEKRLHRALQTHHQHGYRQHVADILEELGGIELDHDRPTAAATLLGAAARVRAEAGVCHRVGRQVTFEADVATLDRVMDPDERAAAHAIGHAMGLDEAVAFAARGWGARGRPTFGWDSLTVTEAHVAELAAQGLTNRQIAEQLIMGRETVKTHMGAILRKLGLTNRTQLAAALTGRRHRATASEPSEDSRPSGPDADLA